MNLFGELTKRCSKCGIEKSISHFELHKSGKSRRRYCYSCVGKIYIKNKAKREGREYVSVEQVRARVRAECKRGIKVCKKCGIEKPFSEFPKVSKGGSGGMNIGGVSWTCKECRRKAKPIYKRAEWVKWLANHPGRQQEKWELHEKQLTRLRIKSREKYRNDSEYRERCKKEAKEDHQKDRSKMLARKHKREALMINQHDGTVTPKQIKRILEERKSCPYCGGPIGKAEIDHMDPISKGGLHSISNIIGCCHRCNSEKHTKSFVEWLSFIKEERRDYVVRLYERKHGARPEQGSLPFKYAA
jgi:hypothetical protein